MGELKIIKNYLTNNPCYQKGDTRTAIGVQLHTIGCGQGTAQSVADYWDQPAVEALVHYIVDCDTEGKVLATLPEDRRAWADGGYGNQNLITFEICESDYIRYTSGAEYDILDPVKFEEDIRRGYQTAVLLCADICSRHGWDPTAKLDSGLYLVSSHREGAVLGLSTQHVDPVHIWDRFGLSMDGFRMDVKAAMGSVTAGTAEPDTWYRVRKTWKDTGSQTGAYKDLETAKANCPAGFTVYDNDGKIIYKNTAKSGDTQATAFTGLSETQAAALILEIVKPIAEKYHLLPSVAAAQTILESGYCNTELAQRANNVCGMKCSLSGNSWAGSTWDQKSKVNIATQEQREDGSVYTVYADFRKYPSIELSIEDRCNYLVNANNGGKRRYAGITACRDYQDQAQLIKNGGYATDLDYVPKLISIVKKFSLHKYDTTTGTSDVSADNGTWYRIRRSWEDAASQVGAYHYLDKAKEDLQKYPGCALYDESGNELASNRPQAMYMVQAGLFGVKTNAYNLVAQMKSAGYIAFVKQDGVQYRVQCGAFKDRVNAEQLVQRLTEDGFSAIIKIE